MSRNPSRPTRRHNRVRLGLMLLEDRLLPSTLFGSDASWGVFQEYPTSPDVKPLGPAQLVSLNGVSTAEVYSYEFGQPGWSADLSTIPGANWVWAPGVRRDDPADLVDYFFAKP